MAKFPTRRRQLQLLFGVVLLVVAAIVISGRDFIALQLPGSVREFFSHQAPSSPPASRPGVDPELAAAAAMMVPPYGIPLSLQADPRRLRRSMERGQSRISPSAAESEQLEGARLIEIAAALGFGPARRMIVSSYARSRVIRSVVSELELVRYSLDAFAAGGTESRGTELEVTQVAAFFERRQDLSTFSMHLIESMRSDPRLQIERRLERLLQTLSATDGMCAALARTVRARDAGNCESSLIRPVLAHVHRLGSAEYDADARRRALWALDQLDDTGGKNDEATKAPTVRVLPGALPIQSRSVPDHPK